MANKEVRYRLGVKIDHGILIKPKAQCGRLAET